MSLREIQVECYEGVRGEERPRRVIIDGRTLIVARLLAESLVENVTETTRSRLFTLLTTEATLLEVMRTSDGIWYLKSERPGKPARI